VHGNDGAGVAAHQRRRPPWPPSGLLALGTWLACPPLVLGVARVITGRPAPSPADWS
jgi:hypothetical protein